MSDAVSSPGLPRRVRAAALVCVLLAGFVGCSSASEAMGLSRLSDLASEPAPNWGNFADKAALSALTDAYVKAMSAQRGTRGVILVLLAFAAAITFVAGARFLRPLGLPREGLRRLLVWGSTVAAVLRVVDGAQMAAVARRIGATAQTVFQGQSPAEISAMATLRPLLPSLYVAGTAGLTVVIAGTFAFLASYFNAASVKSAIRAHDERARPG